MTEEPDAQLRKIELAFPFVGMPPVERLISHSAAQRAGVDYLLSELEEYRGKSVTVELIKAIHQELHNLSAEAWGWILPYYLRFCMSEDGLQSGIELEYLIYKFDPKQEFREETIEKFSLLTKKQIKCLIDIVQWCMNDEYWYEYFPDNLQGAMRFLQSVYRNRST